MSADLGFEGSLDLGTTSSATCKAPKKANENAQRKRSVYNYPLMSP